MCPIFLSSIEKGLELFYPSKASLSHKSFPIDFKVRTMGLHINTEMDEKQIEIFE
jgi:hypothetical protein